MTMSLISTITIPTNGDISIANFLNIPQTFTDLVIMWSARSTPHAGVDDWTACNFNGSSTGPTLRSLYGTGSSVSTGNFSSFELGRMNGNGATSNTFGSVMTYIPNYSGTSAKTWSYDSVGENNATAAYQFIAAGKTTITDPITSIALTPANGPYYVINSTFSLYGILKGSGGATVS
jgi:hypothetical protein